MHIGDDVFVRRSATFTNDLVPRAFNASYEVVDTFVHDGASIETTQRLSAA